MRDKGLITTGLVIFLGLVTFPFWYAKASGETAAAPRRVLPTNAKECVLPVEQMRAQHPKLLMDWRQLRVRDDVQNYTAPDGRTYSISLTGTCLKQCHTNKAEFCDRCHNYEAVQGPYCMDCHVDPRLAARVVAWRTE
jgi:hypothetical protein